MLDAVADGLPWQTLPDGNCPVACRHAKFPANRGSSFRPPVPGIRTTSKNASCAIAPFRGSRMVGQISHTAPPSAPPTSRLPSFPQGEVGGGCALRGRPNMQLLVETTHSDAWATPSRKWSSEPVWMIGVPSRLFPFCADAAANMFWQVGVGLMRFP